MKKILGIYIFYDACGVVDDYVEDVLKQVVGVFYKIFFVVNGEITSSSLERVKKYNVEVVLRENKGYDAGAYKDVFCNYLDNRELENCDELVLMNNSFYGPFFDMNALWRKMEKVEGDFWGITRHPIGELSENVKCAQHIQSYFLVIKKRMFVSDAFVMFWENMDYPILFQDAIQDFELAFTAYFEARGFVSVTLMDVGKLTVEIHTNENPCMLYSYELIRDLQMPFFKRKCLHIENPGYSNSVKALQYIENNTEYRAENIWNNIYRECRNNTYGSILNYNKLEQFYNSHEKVYIYGAGRYGKSLYSFFQYKKWHLESFVVTQKEDDSVKNQISYEELRMNARDGIILALGKANVKPVYDSIKDDLKREQIFTFNNCEI